MTEIIDQTFEITLLTEQTPGLSLRIVIPSAGAPTAVAKITPFENPADMVNGIVELADITKAFIAKPETQALLGL